MREWAKLRYGVFDEHGYVGQDSPYPMFYRQSQNPIAPVKSAGPLVPNVCADKPTLFTVDNGCKVDPLTNLYSSDCTYTLKSDFKPDSSILSDYQMLASVPLKFYFLFYFFNIGIFRRAIFVTMIRVLIHTIVKRLANRMPCVAAVVFGPLCQDTSISQATAIRQ